MNMIRSESDAAWRVSNPCGRRKFGRLLYGGLGAWLISLCALEVSARAQEAPLPLPQEVIESAGPAEAPGAASVEQEMAQEERSSAGGEASGSDSGKLNYSVLQLIRFAGYIGYLIILLSFVALSLVVEYLMSLRKKVLVPPADVQLIRQSIAAGAVEELAARSGDDASFIMQVVARGVAEADRGYECVVKAMEDKADELTGKLLRKIEHLNIIANIAPMLGLLGTVLGMVAAFNQISVSVGGVDPRKLAAGIFQALMTTVMGLIVAIPALYIFGIFRNRVDALVAQASLVAAQLVEPLKTRPESERKLAQAAAGRARP